MNRRIIPCQVNNEYVQGSGVVVGAAGSHDDVVLRLTFNHMWVGLSKYATFRDALGQNPTLILITENMAVPEMENTYDVPVPAAGKGKEGRMMLTLSGYTIENGVQEDAATVTTTAYFRVLPSDYSILDDGSIDATIAQQIQAEIDVIQDEIDKRATIEDLEALSVVVVKTEAQTFTIAQMAQARDNISAASSDDIDAVENSVINLYELLDSLSAALDSLSGVSVKVVQQNLTAAQKAQARSNIGSAAQSSDEDFKAGSVLVEDEDSSGFEITPESISAVGLVGGVAIGKEHILVDGPFAKAEISVGEVSVSNKYVSPTRSSVTQIAVGAVHGIDAPLEDKDAANKKYVDDVAEDLEALSGVAVKTEAQNLTAEQKTQARSNIGAGTPVQPGDGLKEKNGLLTIATKESYGLSFAATERALKTSPATKLQLREKTASYPPITPKILDYAVRRSLAYHTETWTDAEKSSARDLIGAITKPQFLETLVNRYTEGAKGDIVFCSVDGNLYICGGSIYVEPTDPSWQEPYTMYAWQAVGKDCADVIIKGDGGFAMTPPTLTLSGVRLGETWKQYIDRVQPDPTKLKYDEIGDSGIIGVFVSGELWGGGEDIWQRIQSSIDNTTWQIYENGYVTATDMMIPGVIYFGYDE